MATLLSRFLDVLPESIAKPRRFVLRLLPTNSVGVEIGVHRGDFSAEIMQIVRPRELHLIDPWHFETDAVYKDAWYGGKARAGQAEMDARYEAVRTRFDKPIRAGRITIHRGFSTEVGESFADQYLDWVYIDGNHLYEFVKKDLELFFRKVRIGGWLCGDDYTTGGWWQGGVKRAVDEFVRSFPVEQIEIRRRQFVLRRIA